MAYGLWPMAYGLWPMASRFRGRTRQRSQVPARGYAELAIDVARVRSHGLDPDREREGDLRVGSALLEQLEHVGLAGRKQVGAGEPELALCHPPGRRRAREHVHPAR